MGLKIKGKSTRQKYFFLKCFWLQKVGKIVQLGAWTKAQLGSSVSPGRTNQLNSDYMNIYPVLQKGQMQPWHGSMNPQPTMRVHQLHNHNPSVYMLNPEPFCLYLYLTIVVITGKQQQFTEIHSKTYVFLFKKEKKRNRSTDYIKEFQMWNADYLYQK